MNSSRIYSQAWAKGRAVRRVVAPNLAAPGLSGGRRRAGESPLDAACRETEEEVGLALRECPPLGCLAARSPRNRPELLVLPILFAWDRDAEPRPGPEVASVEWVPLAELPRTRTTLTIVIQGRERPMPAFADGRHTIWGFTYRVLEDLLPLVP